MTLKQLLDSLTFDEIAPCILNRYKNYDVRGLLALYKQHFDYLRSLVPTDPDLIERKEARISLYKEGENIHLDAFLWKVTIGRIVSQKNWLLMTK